MFTGASKKLSNSLSQTLSLLEFEHFCEYRRCVNKMKRLSTCVKLCFTGLDAYWNVFWDNLQKQGTPKSLLAYSLFCERWFWRVELFFVDYSIDVWPKAESSLRNYFQLSDLIFRVKLIAKTGLKGILASDRNTSFSHTDKKKKKKKWQTHIYFHSFFCQSILEIVFRTF